MNVRKRRNKDGTTSYQARHQGRGKTFARRSDAEKWWNEQRRRADLGDLYRDPPLTYGACQDSYLTRLVGVTDRTRAVYQQTARHLEQLRDVPVNRLRRATVDDLIAERAATSPRSALKARALLLRVLRDARGRGQQINERLLETPTVRYEPARRRELTLEECAEVAGWMPEWCARIVPFAALTGLRQGELLALGDAAVDLVGRSVFVTAGKTAAARRMVDLSLAAVTLLREQRLARPNPSAEASSGPDRRHAGQPRSDLLFPDHDGTPLAPAMLRYYYRHACKNAGLASATCPYDGPTFHQTRKLFASMMVHAGVDVRTVAAQMGHADGGALLLRTYAHVIGGSGRRGADILDGWLADEREAAEA